MTNVLIIEDSKWERFAFENMIKDIDGYNVIRSIENAANAIILCLSHKIDLIIMDVCTADDESGILAAESIKKEFPHITIIIVTSMPEFSFIQKARDIGCEGFWYKDGEIDSLKDVVEHVMSGEIVYPSQTPRIKLKTDLPEELSNRDLSDRELEVFKLIGQGMTYREIAEKLFITENTVKSHVKNVLSRIDYKSSAAVVAMLVEKGIILPGY